MPMVFWGKLCVDVKVEGMVGTRAWSSGRRLHLSVTSTDVTESRALAETTQAVCRWRWPCSRHLQGPGGSGVWGGLRPPGGAEH